MSRRGLRRLVTGLHFVELFGLTDFFSYKV